MSFSFFAMTKKGMSDSGVYVAIRTHDMSWRDVTIYGSADFVFFLAKTAKSKI